MSQLSAAELIAALRGFCDLVEQGLIEQAQGVQAETGIEVGAGVIGLLQAINGMTAAEIIAKADAEAPGLHQTAAEIAVQSIKRRPRIRA